MRFLLLGLGILTLHTGVAEARVFSFANENLAAFIRGGGGISRANQDAFANSSGTQTDFSGPGAQYNFSGEFGFLYASGPLRFRLGIEALSPKKVEATGKNTSDVDLVKVTSTVFSYAPMLTLEYVYSQAGSVLFYSYLGVGYANVTVDNKYEMAAQGLITYNPLTDHTEKSETTAMPIVGGLGFETMFVDNVTFSLDFGYRHLKINNLKYKADVSTFTGSESKGQPVQNHDGSNRQLDLGGLTVNASFKFYISFM